VREEQGGVVNFEIFFAGAWNGVATERRTPMQQHLWARAAAEALSPTEHVGVVTVGPTDQPTALAPLARSDSGPPRLRLLGAEELGESVEVCYRDEAALEALAAGLVRTRLPLSFGHYLADTPFIETLRRAYKGRGIVVAKMLPMRGSPSIELDESWIEPEQHFSSRRRSDFRRMRRNAEKLGTVTTEILQPSPTEVEPLFEEAMAVEATGWKGRSGTAIRIDQRLERFFRRYTQLACEAGILRMCFLRIDGKAVAMQLAVETDERFWLFKIGYDESYARCSPGNLLMRETIRHAARRGLKSYEFLGKEAPWTELWTQTARPLVALRTYPFNLAGLAALGADSLHSARQALERLLERCRSQPPKIAEIKSSDA
jgi:CelD/BcsL family acetyltransferase involved in cellulose biosynthesis